MAKVVYVSPVKEVSGKLSKADKVIYQVRKAPTSNVEMLANPCYTSAYGARKTPFSATEIAYQTRFGKIAKAVTTRLADPGKRLKIKRHSRLKRNFGPFANTFGTNVPMKLNNVIFNRLQKKRLPKSNLSFFIIYIFRYFFTFAV